MSGNGSLHLSKVALLLVLLIILSISPSASAAPEAGMTSLASVSSLEELADGSSYGTAISADGRFVVFQSNASNLVPDDTNGVYDIFVRDLQEEITVRVSVSSNGEEGNAESNSFRTSISANGRYVTFRSSASNLVPSDINGKDDIFIHDLQEKKTELISISSAREQGNGDSYSPSISADGRFVSFASNASNLVVGDTNGILDIFVRDRQLETTEVISVSSSSIQADGSSSHPWISGNGQHVAFETSSTNLVDGDTNSSSDIMVRDRCPDLGCITTVARLYLSIIRNP